MEHIFADLKELLAVPSLKQLPEEDKPFGLTIDQALDVMLEIARREGFQTHKDPNGYYGYADIGEGEEVFGILCHLDVVPPGTLSEWNNPPFELVIDDEWAYGRGVQDDKGPTLITMHALTDLLKDGWELNKRVRFIFGLDEENDWECINRYLSDSNEIPSMGFVPDGSFPLTYAERGLWQVNLIREAPDSVELKGGVAFNVVPGEVVFEQPTNQLIEQLDQIGYDYQIDGASIKVIGKNAHAAFPDAGKNALTGLLHALHLSGSDSQAARFVSEKLHNKLHGEGLFETNQDDASGEMSVSLGLAELTKDKQVLGLDIRYPVTVPLSYYVQELAEQANAFGFRVEEKSHLDPLYVERDSYLIQSLMSAYQKITGDLISQPEISGGATYARSMENFVAFGAHLPGAEETVHQPNERMALKDMKIAYNIYQEALKKLVFKEKK